MENVWQIFDSRKVYTIEKKPRRADNIMKI